MRKTIVNKIICIVVATLFLINDLAYGLNIAPASRNSTVMEDVINRANTELVAIRGGFTSDFEAVHPIEFVPSEAPRIEGVEVVHGTFDDKFPKLKGRPSFIASVKYFLNTHRIPENDLPVTEKYLSENGPDMLTGALPIFKKMTIDGEEMLAFDKNFTAMFDAIAENDIRLAINTGQGKETVEGICQKIFERVVSRLANKNPEEDWISDAVWMWFLHSYCYNNQTKYDNTMLEARLNWVFESDRAKELGLDQEFQSSKDDPIIRQKAIKLALLINYLFYSPRAKRAETASVKTAKLPANAKKLTQPAINLKEAARRKIEEGVCLFTGQATANEVLLKEVTIIVNPSSTDEDRVQALNALVDHFKALEGIEEEPARGRAVALITLITQNRANFGTNKAKEVIAAIGKVQAFETLLLLQEALSNPSVLDQVKLTYMTEDLTRAFGTNMTAIKLLVGGLSDKKGWLKAAIGGSSERQSVLAAIASRGIEVQSDASKRVFSLCDAEDIDVIRLALKFYEQAQLKSDIDYNEIMNDPAFEGLQNALGVQGIQNVARILIYGKDGTSSFLLSERIRIDSVKQANLTELEVFHKEAEAYLDNQKKDMQIKAAIAYLDHYDQTLKDGKINDSTLSSANVRQAIKDGDLSGAIAQIQQLKQSIGKASFAEFYTGSLLEIPLNFAARSLSDNKEAKVQGQNEAREPKWKDQTEGNGQVPRGILEMWANNGNIRELLIAGRDQDREVRDVLADDKYSELLRQYKKTLETWKTSTLTVQDAIDWLSRAKISGSDDIYDSFRMLFLRSAEETAEFEKLLAERLPTWEKERVAMNTQSQLAATDGRVINPFDEKFETEEIVPMYAKDAKYPLITAIETAFTVQIGPNDGPGSIALDTEQIRSMWETANFLHADKVEVLVLGSEVGTTQTMSDALRDIRARVGRDDVVNCKSFQDEEDLIKHLPKPGEADDHIKRIVLITGEQSKNIVNSLVKKDSKLFKRVRALGFELPKDYSTLKSKEKTFYQASMLMRGLCACLLGKDHKTPWVEMLFKNTLKGCYTGDPDTLIKQLPEAEDETAEATIRRIEDCSNSAIRLLSAFTAGAIEHLKLIMKTFWSAA